MIRRSEINQGRLAARRLLEKANVRLSESELNGMEVADFGLDDYRSEGSQIATFVNTDRVGFKVICLQPGQTLPEHWHDSFSSTDPGKEETLRALYGTTRLYLPGEESIKEGFIPKDKNDAYTCRREVLLNPPDQITLAPGVKHWIQAGDGGCVLFSISSAAHCALDPFTDPGVKRLPEIMEDET